MTRKSVLFVAENVRVFGVPKDETLRLNWVQQLPLWTGNLRVIEEEEPLSNRNSTDQTILESMNYIPQLLLDILLDIPLSVLSSSLDTPKPYQKLRLKLELFTGRNDIWAEIWYNPSNDQLHYHIANNGGETIQVCLDSPRHFRLIAQFPGTGYHPIEAGDKDGEGTEEVKLTEPDRRHRSNEDQGSTPVDINGSGLHNSTTVEKTDGIFNRIEDVGHVEDPLASLEVLGQLSVVQVALGLEFDDLEDAWQFLEVLDRYHFRFNQLVAQYLYGKGIDGIVDGILGFQLEDGDDFDDFGEFVGA